MSNKMIPRVKALWLAALRSGNYNQARGRMRVSKRSAPSTRLDAQVTTGTAHCCLGVLTEVAVEEGILDRFKTASGSNSMPCMIVRKWSGLDKKTADDLASKNDQSRPEGAWPRNNFATIAEWIEKEL